MRTFEEQIGKHWQLHMRRVGVEPRPDLVQGFTRGGSSGSSNDHKDGNSFDDRPRDDGDRSSGGDDREVEPSVSGSHDSDEPIPTSILLANTVLGTDNSARHVSLLCS
jgi:maspardin